MNPLAFGLSIHCQNAVLDTVLRPIEATAAQVRLSARYPTVALPSPVRPSIRGIDVTRPTIYRAITVLAEREA